MSPATFTHFTIIVPAHNEAKVIERTLCSLTHIIYPNDMFKVVVVADNCTDHTVDLVEAAEIECLVRNDPHQTGKGQALGWAFEQLLKNNPSQAFVLIDADSVVDPDLLEVLNLYVHRGIHSIQVYHDVLDPDRTPMASFTYTGYSVSRNLKYAGRSRLNWCGNLLGNGMCFSRELIENYGWNTFSITEDYEFQLQLFMDGILTTFVRETRVYGEIPYKFHAYHRQQSRWSTGKTQLRRRYWRPLLRKVIREKSLVSLDVLLELLAPPYHLLGGLMFMGLGFQIALLGFTLRLNVILWGIMSMSFILYVVIGLMAAGTPPKVYAKLVYAPIFVLWRMVIEAMGFFSTKTRWDKSGR